MTLHRGDRVRPRVRFLGPRRTPSGKPAATGDLLAREVGRLGEVVGEQTRMGERLLKVRFRDEMGVWGPPWWLFPEEVSEEGE